MPSLESQVSRDTSDPSEKLIYKDEEADSASTEPQWAAKPAKWSRWERLWHITIELILIAAIIALVATQRPHSFHESQISYTPASDAIQYETHKFNAGYLPGEKSIYQLDCEDCHPTDAIDAAWSSLYSGIMWSAIPRSQAAQLRNLTIAIPSRPDHYLIGLDVFHQLHCLDNVRKALWPERYAADKHMGGQGMSLLSHKHVDHCIDQIRQSIMCQSDLTPNWLTWSDAFQSNMAARDMMHTCRSFDKVQQWARERAQEPFDLTIRVPDPLKDGRQA